MKNLLVISSATKKAYICLKTDKIEDFRVVDANCKQAESVLPQIDDILNANNLSISDINEIAVVVGPGSFTGIRIGVALVKGICAGNKNINVYPISTLDLMARHIYKQTTDFVCVLNALSSLVFVKTFSKDGNVKSEEKMITLEELEKIKLPKFGLMEEDVCRDKIEFSPSVLMEEAERVLKEKSCVKPNELSPVYIRNSQAEENLKKSKKVS